MLDLQGIYELVEDDGCVSAETLGELLISLAATEEYVEDPRHDGKWFNLHEVVLDGKCYRLSAVIEDVGFVGCCWEVCGWMGSKVSWSGVSMFDCHRVPVTARALANAVAELAGVSSGVVMKKGKIIQERQQSSPDMICATAEEISQLGEELKTTISEPSNEKQILRRYTIAEELRRIAEMVAEYGDELV